MSEEPSNYVRDLLSAGWFNSLDLTKEDLERTHKYKQQEERRSFEEHASSLDDYLHGLDIQLYHIKSYSYESTSSNSIKFTDQSV